MMKNYIVLMRRADFTDMYKFGQFYLDKDKIVSFDCPVSELSKRDDIFDEIFTRINAFESSAAYLLVHYSKTCEQQDNSVVSIEEVEHIYPLDDDAKKDFELTFDRHINIENPIWQDTVGILKKRQMFKNSMLGVTTVFRVFELDENSIKKCKSIYGDNMVEEMLSEVYDNKRPSGDRSLWEYLMRYERHAYYPKNTLGYFMDIAHVVTNYIAKRETVDYEVEGTDIYKILESYQGQKLTTRDILDKLKRENCKFIERVKNFVPDIEFILVAVIYLRMRDMYEKEFTYNKEYIEKLKAPSNENFTLASYMIGIVLGYDKTRSCLYENLPLAIYKSETEMYEISRQERVNQERAANEFKRMDDKRKQKKHGKSTKNEWHGKIGDGPFVPSSPGCGAYLENDKSSTKPQLRIYSETEMINSAIGNKMAKEHTIKENENVMGGGNETSFPFITEVPFPLVYKKVPVCIIRNKDDFERFKEKNPATKEKDFMQLSYPLRLRKYTAQNGKNPAKEQGKNIEMEVKDDDDFEYFQMEHKNEYWRLVQKK